MSMTIPRGDSAQWFAYEAEGDDYVPVEQFGKDHWSTFAYLETRAVDHSGVVENARMRVHARLHREFVHPMFASINDGSAYPTRLKDGELPSHDDYSCLEDMVAAGLLTAEWRVKYHGRTFGNSECRVRLTARGQGIAAKLRAHKMSGGSFSDFRLEE